MPYKYRLINNVLRLYPTPNESLLIPEGIEFIRNANRIEDDESILDLPESAKYVIEFVKHQCWKKENNMPHAPDSEALISEQTLLVDTLNNRTPDYHSNEIIMEYSSLEME
jgi:hypothetical protein